MEIFLGEKRISIFKFLDETLITKSRLVREKHSNLFNINITRHNGPLERHPTPTTKQGTLYIVIMSDEESSVVEKCD